MGDISKEIDDFSNATPVEDALADIAEGNIMVVHVIGGLHTIPEIICESEEDSKLLSELPVKDTLDTGGCVSIGFLRRLKKEYALQYNQTVVDYLRNKK